MTRFFMTIPEASRLILEASLMGEPGDLFVLDMGEPIRIVDLARDLARLAGRDPDSVPIQYIGLRPGEKLHEALFYDAETIEPTAHPKVLRARDGGTVPDGVDVLGELDALVAIGAAGDHDAARAALAATLAASSRARSEPACDRRADPVPPAEPGRGRTGRGHRGPRFGLADDRGRGRSPSRPRSPSSWERRTRWPSTAPRRRSISRWKDLAWDATTRSSSRPTPSRHRPRRCSTSARSRSSWTWIPLTANVDPAAVAAAIGPRTRAVEVVHVGGLPADLPGVIAAAGELPVVEDTAHAFPSPIPALGGRFAGTIGRAGAFSFYATKTITTGEGGMLVTDDAALADRARTMRLHGIGRDAWKRYTATGSWYYEIEAAGFKDNLTDLAAAIGLAQLSRAQELRDARAAIAARYLAGPRGRGTGRVADAPRRRFGRRACLAPVRRPPGPGGQAGRPGRP